MLLAILLALQAAEKGVIEGRVLRAGSGEPIAKASVTLFRQDGRDRRPQHAITNDTGRFSFPNLEPGRYQLSADRNGYVRQQYGARVSNRAGAPLTLDRGQKLTDVVFRLTPHGVIAGRVLDEDGEPVSNVNVQVLRPGYNQGRRQLVPSQGRSMTNDLGEYRIFGLAPGRYYVSAHWFSLGPAATTTAGPGSPELTYAPTYFPGVVEASQAAPIEVTAGAELRGMDLRLLRIPTVRIRGKVANMVTGRPSREIMVGLTSRDGFLGSRSFSSVDAEGLFELRGVAPGAYHISAQWSDGTEHYWAWQRLDVGNSDVENVQLTLSPGMELTGRLRIEGKAESASAEVRVGLEPADARPMGASPGLVQRDGGFRIRNVAPGAYRVLVVGGGDALYLKSARLGDTDALTELDLSAGAAGALELVMSANGARLEGAVTDEQNQPVSGVQVWLVPDSRRRSQRTLFRMASTDQNGRFSLRGLAPGDYQLFAWEDVEYGAPQDPEFLQQFEDKGKSVSLRDNAQESVNLKLIPAVSAAAGAAR
jgi:protocatechuate 3,4-dioxygenase beta subunit